MESTTRQEEIDFCKKIINEFEPYPDDVYDKMSCYDGPSHIGDMRYAASTCLQALLQLGFTEDEVNPWKHKN